MESADDIYFEAREIADAAARAAYLARACGGEPELCRRVEAMLQDAAGADDFFHLTEKLAVGAAGCKEPAGRMIGRYKLLEEIGEGGFGTVYVAEQQEPVKRLVALKIIKLGMDTRQVVGRFEAERQALALMEHPNIAKVFDGGVSETGRPYFVMELVRGVPLTGYCDENRIPLRGRLELFAQVCQAVQHAHQKGIIHRDLKPSNLLVTANDGAAVPKVIDFGIAKATQQEPMGKSNLTHFHQFVGTPAYMSPEQAEMTSVDIDTRSDIYSLGVVLYELLTGRTPFDEGELMQAGLDNLRRAIREKEPLRPSTRLKNLQGEALTTAASRRSTGAPKLIHLLRDELDWIVMKCLEKDRARRYETANGLAAEIQRYLNNEPLVAKPPSAAYRFQKMVRRRKLQFAAAMFTLTVLLLAVTVSSWQAVRATRAEQNAKLQADIARQQSQLATQQSERAEAVKEFLIGNLLGVDCCGDSVDPDAISFEATQALLEKVARRMEGKFTNQPLTEAEIRMALIQGFNAARDYRKIAAQAEKVFQTYRSTFGPSYSNTLVAVKHLAYAKYQNGERKQALGLLTNAMAVARAAPNGLGPDGIAVVGTYGLLLQMEGRVAEALPYLTEAVEWMRQNWPTNMALTAWMSKLAVAKELNGQVSEAEALWREAIALCQRDHGPEHPQTINQQQRLANLLINQKRAGEAVPLLERVLGLSQARLGANNFSTLDAQFWLGQAYEQQKDIEGAAKLYADCYPRLVKHLTYHAAKEYLSTMARFFARHGRFAEAKAVSLPLRKSLAEMSEWRPSELQWLLEATAATTGWFAAADIYRKHFDAFANTVTACRTMGTVFLYLCDEDGYRKATTRALSLVPTLRSWEEQQNVLSIVGLGTNALSPEHVRLCEELIQAGDQAQETMTQSQQSSFHRTAGAMLLRLGRLTNSLERLSQAQVDYRSGLDRARVLMLKAICLHHLGQRNEAGAAFGEGEWLMRSLLFDRVDESDGFLNQGQLTYLIHRREAQQLLGAK